MTTDLRNGGCLCGDVRYQVSGGVPGGSVCHCAQCRKQSGHVWASTHIPDTNLTLTASDSLRWYSASDTAKRGFCGTCGSFLFWKPTDEPATSVAMGSLAAPTGLHQARHILTADKGDYYPINDDIPQLETS